MFLLLYIIYINIYIYILFWFFHLVEGWKNDWRC